MYCGKIYVTICQMHYVKCPYKRGTIICFTWVSEYNIFDPFAVAKSNKLLATFTADLWKANDRSAVNVKCCQKHRSGVTPLTTTYWSIMLHQLFYGMLCYVATLTFKLATVTFDVTCSEEKERWIRRKYEKKEFLPPLPRQDFPTHLVRCVNFVCLVLLWINN